jgi:ABC-type multidrug transport system fused ATPase/permease subunit
MPRAANAFDFVTRFPKGFDTSVGERGVQLSGGQLMTGRTTLVIAHRLSTVVGASRVLVLDGGRLVQSGSHRD